MTPLEVGGTFVDRQKSALLLHYLAKAALRVDKRELHKKEMETGLRHLQHLNTSELKQHIHGLDKHITLAEEKVEDIKGKQQEEDLAHKDFNKRLKHVHEKMSELLVREQAVKKKLAKVAPPDPELKYDIKRLEDLYRKAKASKKYPKAKLDSIKKRIDRIHSLL